MDDKPDQDRTFHYLVDSVSDYAIYMLDRGGRVTTWNVGARRLKGFSGAEIEGQHFSRFFPLEDRRAGVPERILEEAAREGRVELEGWRVRKDGTRFWALGVLHAVKDDKGDLIGFAKVTRDMTRQRTTQQALIESERRFRLLVEGVVDYSIFMLDVNGAVTNWNRGAERIKGYTAGEVVGRHFSLFYTPEDRQAGLPARALATALKEGRFEAEGWRLRKDGSRFWASVIIDPIHDEEGELLGFTKITRDISEKRAADQALAASERQFRMLVLGVVDYSIYMLDPNGIVANWNAGAEHIKGYKSEEIVGQHFSRFYTDADRAAGLPARALQAATEHGRFEAEAWRVRKDGSLFWAMVVIDAIRDEDGRLVGFAKITRDITEKRNAALQLQRAHDQLAQSQKMEALGKLTGGVAHDFNNLLMVIGGQAQLLRGRLAEDERVQRALDAIEAAAGRGEELTRHLLAFSRRQRLRPAPLSLVDRVDALHDLLRTSLPPTVQFEVDLPPELWPIQADAGELEVALLNLGVNARDAMPDGGSLIIRGENVELTPPDAEDGLSGQFVAITVSDTGDGIAPDILPHIFDPFFSTKSVDKGTGLGLSQVFGFAEQSGGRVAVTSELGGGSVFTLYLPRAIEAPRGAEAAPPDVPVRSVEVLLVEDNPDVAEVAAGMLEQLGHRVRVVGGALAALDAVHQQRPDLVFSDIVMAGDIDGLGLARRIREEIPQLPVLLATGYSQTAERIGDEFPILRKPYKLAELNAAVAAQVADPTRTADNLVSLEGARRARNKI